MKRKGKKKTDLVEMSLHFKKKKKKRSENITGSYYH